MTRRKIVIIDNYDSFTYNVAQYLHLAAPSAKIRTFRNDEVTIKQLERLNPTSIVISPGPGHPKHDSGISIDVIKYFSGKVPILGVCMGLQCIVTAFGGTVDCAGEILHGKTSDIHHDGRGIYKDVEPEIQMTRYHSLAAVGKLPDCFLRSSWTDSGVVMGVRHKLFTIEGVQFHPESILSIQGLELFKNFVALDGGHWHDSRSEYSLLNGAAPISTANPAGRANDTDPSILPNAKLAGRQLSILEQIFQQRRIDVEHDKTVPGRRTQDLQDTIKMNACPPVLNVLERLARFSVGEPALMAEFKRASPSKQDIAVNLSAASVASEYASAGAALISCLTEPTWFKGSLEDMRACREAVESMRDRPAILRKDFIFDEYQILEARVYGADTVLLIVAMLSRDRLWQLYEYSRSLNMEPLVEVANSAEMQVAVDLHAKFIGVNNRDLHTFKVDLDTFGKLSSMVAGNVFIASLSGIKQREDVLTVTKLGSKGILVGEALMRAANKRVFADALLGRAKNAADQSKELFVKVCGVRKPECALAAIDAGANAVGIIFVPGAQRAVTVEKAAQIVEVVRHRRILRAAEQDAVVPEMQLRNEDWFSTSLESLRALSPITVGVFSNATLEQILSTIKVTGIDAVQLMDGNMEICKFIPVPVLKRFAPNDERQAYPGLHSYAIVEGPSLSENSDVPIGGTGKQTDWSLVRKTGHKLGVRPILAGGLCPENVQEALQASGAVGVDVSSGVELNSEQSVERIYQFVSNARATNRSIY